MIRVSCFIVGIILISNGTYAGALETGALTKDSITGASALALHVRGRVVQKLPEGVIVHGEVPGAKRTNGFIVAGNMYVKGVVAHYGLVDSNVREAGTFSYRDVLGNAKTVRAYEAVK